MPMEELLSISTLDELFSSFPRSVPSTVDFAFAATLIETTDGRRQTTADSYPLFKKR
jgi:hypothetical protein